MNIVITGASSGIGLRTAEKLIAAGHQVFNVSRNPAGTPHIHDVLVDLSESDAVERAIKTVSKECGRIDVGIYCAGYSIAGSIKDVDLDDVHSITQVDYLSAVAFVKNMESAMKHRGRIIIISSMAGYFPLPYEPYYSAAKAALIAYCRSLSFEWRNSPMSICCLTPGGVSTSFSRHRQKVYGKHENPNLNAAISAITDIEQGGKLADEVADKLVGLLEKPKLPVTTTVCFSETLKIGMAKLLPSKAVDGILARKFNQRKPKIIKVVSENKPVEKPQIIDLTKDDQSEPALPPDKKEKDKKQGRVYAAKAQVPEKDSTQPGA